MPKTKFQNFIFTLMTVILIAHFMIVYNIAINSSEGLVNGTFLIALKRISSRVYNCIYIGIFCGESYCKETSI